MSEGTLRVTESRRAQSHACSVRNAGVPGGKGTSDPDSNATQFFPRNCLHLFLVIKLSVRSDMQTRRVSSEMKGRESADV